MTQQETLLIKQGFEFSHQDNSRTHYVKDLGGDGFTYLHIFLKPDGSSSYRNYKSSYMKMMVPNMM